jgi:diguanylate cyclase (GGDEF)-like protein
VRVQSRPAMVEDRQVSLAELAAQVRSLGFRGDIDAARLLAESAVDGATGAASLPSGDLASLWLAIAVWEKVRGDSTSLVRASDRCLSIAASIGSAGFASNALSLRAMARVGQGNVELALADLARSEVELAECADTLLRGWAHTSLACCYDALRLYELAEPHLAAALDIESSSMGRGQPFVLGLSNLAELHLRWAEELERVSPSPAVTLQVEGHREQARHWARESLLAAHPGQLPSGVLASQILDLRARADTEPAAVLRRLSAELNESTRTANERAEVAIAIARAVRALGRGPEAVVAARAAVEVAAGSTDWQVTAGARYLLVELEAEAGVPGAEEGRAYGRLLSDVIWQQHLQTLQGARSALEVERLQRTNETVTRAASEDSLTGLGNRRALDEALVRLEKAADGELEHSLVLIDLDDFKSVNDTYGHLVGDEVLKEVARALRRCARRADRLVRLGGDEFVVLAAGAAAVEAAALGARIQQAIEDADWAGIVRGLTVRISIGFASTGAGLLVGDLLGAADESMYTDKRRQRELRLLRS